MASSDQRKRSHETAFHEALPQGPTTKRVRLNSEDAELNTNVLHPSTSQPMATRHFRPANELEASRSLSLPSEISNSDKTTTEIPSHRQPSNVSPALADASILQSDMALESPDPILETTLPALPDPTLGQSSPSLRDFTSTLHTLPDTSAGIPLEPHSEVTHTEIHASVTRVSSTVVLTDASFTFEETVFTEQTTELDHTLPMTGTMQHLDSILELDAQRNLNSDEVAPEVDLIASSDLTTISSSSPIEESETLPAVTTTQAQRFEPCLDEPFNEETASHVVQSGARLPQRQDEKSDIIDAEESPIPGLLSETIAEVVAATELEQNVEAEEANPTQDQAHKLLPDSSPLSSPEVDCVSSSPTGVPLEPLENDPNPFMTEPKDAADAPVHVPELVVSSPVLKPTGRAPSQKQANKKENVHPMPKPEEAKPDERSLQASTDLAKSSPNHPSTASQQRSNKKIRTPFRSPLRPKEIQGQGKAEPGSTVPAFPDLGAAPSEKKVIGSRRPVQSKIKGSGTAAAKAAFKPPLIKNASTKVVPASSSRNPQVQSLQQRLQLLRRAVKIQESGEDEKLEELTNKWKDVAKQVAWELWDIVKDGNVEASVDSYSRGPGGATGEGKFGTGGTFEQNWGWDNPEEKDSKPKAEEEEEEEEPAMEQRTMGIMLRQLGIAHETLGWNEQNEDFADVE